MLRKVLEMPLFAGVRSSGIVCLWLSQHSIERTPQDQTRYARLVAVCAAFRLVFWGGDGVGGGGWGVGGGGGGCDFAMSSLSPGSA